MPSTTSHKKIIFPRLSAAAMPMGKFQFCKLTEMNSFSLTMLFLVEVGSFDLGI